ncbi:putative Metal dependent phosphohydrolase [Desulfamplus magnetovallimortis]|uniref:Putative Metal dependent phosphohydrolase n=1 Tax=Desulfamplus magnetovallimortis TaxID=1246637 RepID=A0A1W1H8E7_9BACT|nr:response regulator [Desulfamplus magnetovallimortis]SLM28760.1 putative Metal dependent phosphohydrolase [Desulfamplus magnetovallimortis]
MAKILIIEDEESNRRLLRTIFEMNGHEVLEANNGSEGIELFEANFPELIFLDIVMPGLSGIDVLKKVRTIEKDNRDSGKPDTVIIMLTGYADKKTILECHKSGCSDYVVKPASYKILTNKLEKFGYTMVAEAETAAEKTISEVISAAIEEFNKGKIELPSIPYIVQELQEIMDNETAENADIAKVIEKDTSISIKLIALANSPYYKGIEKVVNIQGAIARLGRDQIQSIVVSIANKKLYRSQDPAINKMMNRAWMHSLACAHCAREIAGKKYPELGDKVFVKGLIHDVGATLLCKHIADKYSVELDVKLDELIDKVFEVHTGFGAKLMEKWQFSQDFVDVVKFHEWTDFNEEIDVEVLIVNVADAMADKLGYNLFNKKNLELSELKSVKLLELSPDFLDEIYDEAEKSIKEQSEIMGSVS